MSVLCVVLFVLCAVQELIKRTDDQLEKDSLEIAHNEMRVTTNIYCYIFILNLFHLHMQNVNANSCFL